MVEVNGQAYSATITEVKHPYQLMFSVRFADEYENIFFNDVETGRWVEQDLGFTQLADELGKTFSTTSARKPAQKRKLKWISEIIHDKVVTFGYHLYIAEGYKVYEIYSHNRRYMFTLVKLNSELWQYFKIPMQFEWDYDQSFIEEIPYLIDTNS